MTENRPSAHSLDKPDKLTDLLPQADVIVLACPLTGETGGLISGKQFEAMKKIKGVRLGFCPGCFSAVGPVGIRTPWSSDRLCQENLT